MRDTGVISFLLSERVLYIEEENNNNKTPDISRKKVEEIQGQTERGENLKTC